MTCNARTGNQGYDQSSYSNQSGHGGNRSGHGDSGPNQNVGLANQEGGMNKQLGHDQSGGQSGGQGGYQWGQGFGSGFGSGFQGDNRVSHNLLSGIPPHASFNAAHCSLASGISACASLVLVWLLPRQAPVSAHASV